MSLPLIPLRITAGMSLQLDSSVAVDLGPEILRGSIPVTIRLCGESRDATRRIHVIPDGPDSVSVHRGVRWPRHASRWYE